MNVACPSIRFNECGKKGHMRKDCQTVLCYFCREKGHQKAACTMAKRRKVQAPESASGTNDSSSSTAASKKGTARNK